MSPEDIRAAAEVHAELGPEYSDAVVAAFIAEVDRQVAARVEARLASTVRSRPAGNGSRGQLVKGMAIGVCAGALTVAGIGLAVPRVPTGAAHSPRVAPTQQGPMHAHFLPYYMRPGARIDTPLRPGR